MCADHTRGARVIALREQNRQSEVALSVSEETLALLGWRRVVARTEGIEHLLSPLLAELRRDDCVHSWRQRLPKYGHIDSASVVGLLEAEKVRRPTTTFAYVAISDDDSEHVVAAGTISDRVRSGFNYDAFPVLARCFIREAYRGHGLYRAILRHRYDACFRAWGDRLAAIHLGSAEPAVWAVAMKDSAFPSPFVHIGDEELEVADAIHPVRDFLAFGPHYVKRLLAQVDEAGDGPCVRALATHIETLTSSGLPEASIVRVRELAETASDESGVELLDLDTPLHALTALGEAIPVVR
jgi:GNAT superfamily N-acetyltransferase